MPGCIFSCSCSQCLAGEPLRGGDRGYESVAVRHQPDGDYRLAIKRLQTVTVRLTLELEWKRRRRKEAAASGGSSSSSSSRRMRSRSSSSSTSEHAQQLQQEEEKKQQQQQQAEQGKMSRTSRMSMRK